jgi:hypothetical protein
MTLRVFFLSVAGFLLISAFGVASTAFARDPELLNGPSNPAYEGDPTGGVYGYLDGIISGSATEMPPPTEGNGRQQNERIVLFPMGYCLGLFDLNLIEPYVDLERHGVHER